MNHHQHNLKIAPLFYTRELLGVWGRQHPTQAEICKQAADFITQEPERARRIIKNIGTSSSRELVENFLGVIRFMKRTISKMETVEKKKN